MVSKVIQTNTGNDVKYKIIKDGYKTVSETIHVDDTLPTRSTYNLEPSSIVYDPQLNYTIDTTHDYPPVVTFNDNVVAPDDIEIEENKYVLAPYGEEYLIIDNSEDVDDFARVGTINVEKDGIISNFSTTNYIVTNTSAMNTANEWEMVFKIKTGSDISSTQNFFTYGDGGQGILGYMEAGIFRIYANASATSHTWDVASNVQIIPATINTTYWFKYEKKDNRFSVYYSLNGTEFTLSETFNSIPTALDTLYIGWRSSSFTNEYFRGTIDLSECYIKADNQDLWIPTWKRLYQQYYPTNNLYIYDGVASSFNSSNYIRIYGFQNYSQPWEIGLRVYLTSTSGTNALLGCVENRYYCPYLSVIDGKLRLYLSSNGSSWNILSNRQSSSTISANTWHTIRLFWTGSYYRVYVDGSSYISYSSSTSIIRNAYPLCIGKYLSSSTALPNGIVDLKNCYIKVNDQYTWRPYDIYKLGNYSMAGTPILTGNYETFGFNASNYYTTSLDLTNYNNFEIFMKITTPSDTTDTNGAFFSNNTTDASPFRRDGTTLTFWSPNTGSLGSYQMNNGTTHWVKGYSDGSMWYLYGKPYNGETLDEIINSTGWTLSSSCTASYILSNGNNSFVFGRNTNTYSNQYFLGSIDLKYLLIKKNDSVILKGVEQVGEYMPGILDPNYVDDGSQTTLNLYDVQTNERSLILNTDRNLNISGKKYVQYDGQMNIPDHGLSIYDSTNKTWSKYRFITLNVNDQDTLIYTEGNI